MRNRFVRMGVAAAGITVLAITGAAAMASAGTTAGSWAKAGSAVASAPQAAAAPISQAAPAVYEPEMSDAEIERYLAAYPLEEVDASEVTSVAETLGVELEVDPDTGCLTREAAASVTMPEGADEAAITVGPDLEMPNCWDLVNYLRRHPAS